MRTFTSWLAAALVVATLGGCAAIDREYRDWDDRDARDPECRRYGGGRVDMVRWRAIVDDFVTSQYRGRQEFQRTKRDLLDDLSDVHDRACAWEKKDVQRLWQRVRDYRYRDTWD
jgi:hypothetical protein